ncbi:hypothetical protein Y032_0012g1740 [Ancylostoma ceylanicum]|uniref:Uncharacterized protein n=1 Tax=Ancylostoma ceylanicum TaxID=53326 RepID=A0A016VBY6_9BILA|nr:hypothetical protein Y032_0012g1740 [Ancylostoma ceylanicum]
MSAISSSVGRGSWRTLKMYTYESEIQILAESSPIHSRRAEIIVEGTKVIAEKESPGTESNTHSHCLISGDF